MIFLISGPPGSGKTAFSRHLLTMSRQIDTMYIDLSVDIFKQDNFLKDFLILDHAESHFRYELSTVPSDLIQNLTPFAVTGSKKNLFFVVQHKSQLHRKLHPYIFAELCLSYPTPTHFQKLKSLWRRL